MSSRRGLARAELFGWLVVAGLTVFGVLSILSIGGFVLPIPLLLAGWLLHRRGTRLAAIPIALAAYPLGLLAWVNRAGPVNECVVRSSDGTTTKTCTFVPWDLPFAVGALICLAVAAAIATRALPGLPRDPRERP